MVLLCSAAQCDIYKPTIPPELVPETLTDLPRGAIDDFEQATTVESSDEVDSVTIPNEGMARQNEVEFEINAMQQQSTVASLSRDNLSTAEYPEHLGDPCPEEHFVWNACGPRCYQTCAFQPKSGDRLSRAVCEAANENNCHTGCFCESGYVRFNDKCVLPIDCPTRACILSNEEYRQCGTACTITCDSYQQIQDIENQCPDICVRGCFCKHGYVRSSTGLCILPTRCPRPFVL